MNWNRSALLIGKWALIVVVLLFTLFPLYWAGVSALRGPQGITADTYTLWPTSFDLTFFERVWKVTPLPRQFLNSLIVAAVTTVLTVLLSVSMSYALSRFRFRGSSVIQNSMLLGYMVPQMVLAIPLFGTFVMLGLDDTLVGLSIAHLAICLPFGVWMMTSFMKTVPFDIEEAAWMDGASRLQTIVRIILPVATPGIIAVAVFTFVLSFTDYVFGLILISTNEKNTISVGLANFATAPGVMRGDLLAGATLIAIPMLVLMSFLGRYFIKGMTAGAVKG